jgi:hypothetical protein
MGGRTMPTECAHGVTVDWGDFGPCQNCDEHGDELCPNVQRCWQCDEELEAQIVELEEAAIAHRRRLWQDGYLAGYQQGRQDEHFGQPALVEAPAPPEVLA